MLGIILPGVPATIFFLLATYCFARSSPRLHRWLVTHRWFGPYIRGAQAGGRIPRRQALQTMAVLWLSIGITAWLIDSWGLRLTLLVIAIGVSVFLERRSRPAAARGGQP